MLAALGKQMGCIHQRTHSSTETPMARANANTGCQGHPPLATACRCTTRTFKVDPQLGDVLVPCPRLLHGLGIGVLLDCLRGLLGDQLLEQLVGDDTDLFSLRTRHGECAVGSRVRQGWRWRTRGGICRPMLVRAQFTPFARKSAAPTSSHSSRTLVRGSSDTQAWVWAKLGHENRSCSASCVLGV